MPTMVTKMAFTLTQTHLMQMLTNKLTNIHVHLPCKLWLVLSMFWFRVVSFHFASFLSPEFRYFFFATFIVEIYKLVLSRSLALSLFCHCWIHHRILWIVKICVYTVQTTVCVSHCTKICGLRMKIIFTSDPKVLRETERDRKKIHSHKYIQILPWKCLILLRIYEKKWKFSNGKLYAYKCRQTMKMERNYRSWGMNDVKTRM